MVPEARTSSLAIEAADRYHQLLQEAWPEVAAALTRETQAREVSFLGRPVARALRPFFIDDDQYRSICRGAELVGRAIDQLAARLLDDRSLRNRLRLSPRDEFLVSSERNPRPLFARMDGFVGEDGVIRFVEYNPNPFGAVFTDVVGDIFEALPSTQQMSADYGWRRESTRAALVDTIARAQRERGRSGRTMPNVAVVASNAGAARMAETEGRHLVQLAAAAGAQVRMVAPDSLRRQDGMLVSNDYPIDCLTFGDNQQFLDQFSPEHDVWTALAEGEVWLFGSLAVMALHGNKTLFAMLSDPEYRNMFDADVAEALERHIPWTRIVESGTTGFHGQEIELLDLLSSQRERFVLKPAQEFGGRDVTLGWHSDAEMWEAALQQAQQQPYVVQERVHVPSEPFPFVVDGALQIAPRRVDVNPFLWADGTARGALIRVSDSDMLNITLGTGTLAPLFILKDRK